MKDDEVKSGIIVYGGKMSNIAKTVSLPPAFLAPIVTDGA